MQIRLGEARELITLEPRPPKPEGPDVGDQPLEHRPPDRGRQAAGVARLKKDRGLPLDKLAGDVGVPQRQPCRDPAHGRSHDLLAVNLCEEQVTQHPGKIVVEEAGAASRPPGSP